MISFFSSKTDAVQFAFDLRQRFGPVSVSITSTYRGAEEVYAVCCASGVIVSSSEDIVDPRVQSFYDGQVSI